MVKSKLIQLLKALTPAEMKDFSRYLQGTAFRKGGAVLTLFEYLKKQHPEFPDAKIEKELVHRKTRKDNKPLGRHFFDVVSKLNQEVEDYLLLQSLKEKSVDRELRMLDIFRKRRLDKLFFQKASLLEKNWDKVSEPGTESLYLKYQMLDQLITHPQFMRYDFDVVAKQHELISSLDQHYISAKLLNSMILVLEWKGNKEGSPENFEDEILLLNPIRKEIEKSGDVSIPALAQIFAKVLKSNIDNDFSHYDEIWELYTKYFNEFSLREKVDIAAALDEYCRINHYNGKPGFLKKVFELHAFSREQNILAEDGMISRIRFLNIVNIGQSLGEIEWTKSFVDEYAPCLKSEIRLHIVTLSKAKLLFSEGNYEEILSLLSSIQFTDTTFGIEARIIQVQSFYMLGEEYDDSLESLLHSFKAFVSRHSDLTSKTHENSINFIHFVERAHKERRAVTTIKAEEILKDIRLCSAVFVKKWIIEQVSLLNK